MKTAHSVWFLLFAGFLSAGCQATRRPEPPVIPKAATAHEDGPKSVIVKGNVRYPVIPWTEDLSVARAIDAAEYVGVRDPLSISVRRRGDRFFVSTQRLVQGIVDPWLEPGDIVEIRTATPLQIPSTLATYQSDFEPQAEH